MHRTQREVTVGASCCGFRNVSRGPHGVVFEGGEGEPIGVIGVALAHREAEEDEGSGDQRETHKDLENDDFHRALLPESDAVVAASTVSELRGMNTAQSSGDMCPERLRVTETTL